ncbi:hypothetical protein ACA910_001966 [Epithemia clementina (nom. ined.)]
MWQSSWWWCHKNQYQSSSLYTVPISEIFPKFHARNRIDYMLLDAQGAEYFVMKEFPFHQYTIMVLTVERVKQPMVDLLTEHGYVHMTLLSSGIGDSLWCHNSFCDSLNETILHDMPHVQVTSHIQAKSI